MRFPAEYPTDAELQALDDELAAEGVPILKRPGTASMRWAERHGIAMFSDILPASSWFEEKFAALHPSVNFRNQVFAYLCVTARGVAYELNPPVIYGAMRVDPLKWVKIDRVEAERIHANDTAAFNELYCQAVDCYDLFAGDTSFSPKAQDAADMMGVGTDLLETNARQLVSGRQDKSLAQSMCLAAEAVIKAVLHESGVPISQLASKKSMGHQTSALANELALRLPGPNDAELATVAASMPNYVSMRYKPPSRSANEDHDLYRRALFLSAEALRRFYKHGVYYQMLADRNWPKRQW